MANFNVDDEFIRRLAALLEETGLTEIELAEGEHRVRVARTAVVHSSVPAATPQSAPQGASAAASEGPGESAAPANPASHPGALTSPMVGTAYMSPEPGAAPFVKAGDTVAAGDTVLIIEAMKVMNPIRAPKSGTIRDIIVADAQPVEFGEVLLIIE